MRRALRYFLLTILGLVVLVGAGAWRRRRAGPIVAGMIERAASANGLTVSIDGSLRLAAVLARRRHGRRSSDADGSFAEIDNAQRRCPKVWRCSPADLAFDSDRGRTRGGRPASRTCPAAVARARSCRSRPSRCRSRASNSARNSPDGRRCSRSTARSSAAATAASRQASTPSASTDAPARSAAVDRPHALTRRSRRSQTHARPPTAFSSG